MSENKSPESSTEMRDRILSATYHSVNSHLSGKPLFAKNEVVARLENAERHGTSLVERFYTKGAGRRFLPLNLLYGADGDGAAAIRRITDRAVKTYNRSDNDGFARDAKAGDLVAIATSRIGERWRISDASTLEVVAELIKFDLHCDFDLFADTEVGSCVERQRNVAEGYGRVCGEAERDRYVAENTATVVFAHGDLVIFARICEGCWRAFVYRNNVDTKECEIVEPWTDGFGSV